MGTSADRLELGEHRQLPLGHDANQSEGEDNRNRQEIVDNFAQRTFRHEHLDRVLERPQLSGITLSNLRKSTRKVSQSSINIPSTGDTSFTH